MGEGRLTDNYGPCAAFAFRARKGPLYFLQKTQAGRFIRKLFSPKRIYAVAWAGCELPHVYIHLATFQMPKF